MNCRPCYRGQDCATRANCNQRQYWDSFTCIDCPTDSICDGKDFYTCPPGLYVENNECKRCSSYQCENSNSKDECGCSECEPGYEDSAKDYLKKYFKI